MTKQCSSSRREFLHKASALTAGVSIRGEIGLDESKPPLANGIQHTQDEAFWLLIKQQYFIEDGLIYLNSGTYGPTLRSAHQTAVRLMQEQAANYIKTFRATLYGETIPQFITKIADFVGAKSDEIAFTSSTTEAMNYLANGLDLKPGDEIITTKHEHQGGLYPWLMKAKRHGVVVKQVDLSTPALSSGDIIERLRAAFTSRTRIMSICHVNYTDGTLMPVRELCQLARERGVMSVVDGAQSLGMLDFKISDMGCDFFASSWHKWMCAPYGTGLLYVRSEMRDRLWPSTVLSFSGWDTRDRDGLEAGVTDISYAGNYPKAFLKYSNNVEYFAGLYLSVANVIDLHRLIGKARIEARIRSLADRVYAGLREIGGVKMFSPADPKLRTGLISFRSALSSDALYYKMHNEHRITGRFIRHRGIGFDVNRLAPNIFNTIDEIDHTIATVKSLTQT